MSDDELDQLMRRTRASRDRIKARLASVGNENEIIYVHVGTAFFQAAK